MLQCCDHVLFTLLQTTCIVMNTLLCQTMFCSSPLLPCGVGVKVCMHYTHQMKNRSVFFVIHLSTRVYLHSPEPQMSAGMLAYANACHCGQSTRSVCIYALVECMRCARARIDILPVFGISILFLWEYS